MIKDDQANFGASAELLGKRLERLYEYMRLTDGKAKLYQPQGALELFFRGPQLKHFTDCTIQLQLCTTQYIQLGASIFEETDRLSILINFQRTNQHLQVEMIRKGLIIIATYETFSSQLVRLLTKIRR